ncbi:MAG TPA: peptide MFS transporter [Gemmatimonadaceae bacterium]|jgi:POT family proton-dependent oligopeptide transporter
MSFSSRQLDVFADRSLFGHPKGLGLLFVTEMWERFSYYGMRALLVLYLVNAQHWTAENAATLYGNYTMLVFLTPLVGGYLADRVIGTRRSLVIGGIIIAAGHFTLAFQGTTAFYTGLGLIIIGTGFFKSNVSTQVGEIYAEGDARRDAGFTIFYMGINTGAFLGPIICGYLAASPSWGWHYGFAAAGVGMVLGLITYVWGRERYLPGIGLPKRDVSADARSAGIPGSHPMHGIGGAVAGGVLGWIGGGWLGLAMGAVIGGALGIAILGSHGEERRRVYAIFIVAFFIVFFWAAYEQAGSSMNLFADRNTDLTLGGHLSKPIPAEWFQSVNSAFILIFSPIFAIIWAALAKRRAEPSTAMKMVLGLALLGVGFVFMVVGAKGADQGLRVSWVWLTTAYMFHTLGELCLSPIGLSYVTKVAPVRFASLMMGVWFLSNAAANKLAGTIAAMVEKIPTLTQFYTIFVVSSFSAAFLMLLCVPLLKRLTASVKA